jgi:alkanesulfonate monooxygenase SsuD/methylene tetrahydromethanopterin reductase-like flavin-dependent oxidoreductase (luciferase family)
MSAEVTAERGLGLAATVSEAAILDTAQAVERLHYHSFWLNNPPGSDALGALGSVAARSGSRWLGVGVIPLTHQNPDQIAGAVRAQNLPLDYLYLGIGAGGGPGGVERVEAGIRGLREALDCYVVVAAMGPKMCRLAGAQADGILFNWLTPEWAARSREWVMDGAARAGRSIPRIMAYVRVALGTDGITRLEREAANYEAIPHYASHFARMGTRAFDTAVSGMTSEEIQAGLARWDGVVDEVVVRAITAHDTVEELAELVEAARPSGSVA